MAGTEEKSCKDPYV